MKSLPEFDIRTKLYASGALLIALGAVSAVAVIAQLGALGDAAALATPPARLATEISAIRTTAMVLLGCGIGAGALLCLWIAREATRPMQEAARLARAIADGRLRERAAFGSAGLAGLLLDTLQQMGDKLHGMVRELNTGSESIMRGAGEIANGSMDLSARTEQQASSLEQTASSMEELTSTVKQNADHAHQASRLAISASEVAVKGGEVVSEVVGTMASINESSKRIAEIIGVIDGIAFQTNILALNAAVEAARAGEQGRGFAVVASEVRSLAQRSAAAAKEIKELIDDSVEKVNAGTQLADKAGSTMNEVVTSVKRVTDIIAEIADASAEQTTGIEQVNRAIAAMDHSTQQNAALVEESAAAAAAMREQAGGLARIVSGFGAAGAPQPAANRLAAGSVATSATASTAPAPKARPATSSASARPAAANASPRPAARRKQASAGGAQRAAVPDVDWEEF